MPVRLLHTSDWHVGGRIARQSRDEEMRGVLAEVRDLAVEHAADAVVVAGDLFDQAHPSGDAERIVLRALYDLYEVGLQVVLVAGNHDSPKRWSAHAAFLRLGGVHALGMAGGPDDRGPVVLTGRDGTEAEMLLLPWVPERALVRTSDLLGMAGAAYQSYAEGMSEIVTAVSAARQDPSRPAVLVGHMFCQGAVVGAGERPLTSGDLYAVPAGIFPASLSYVALGHAHRAQRVPARVPVHYSGSLLQLDFSEQREAKSVKLVELMPGAPAMVTEAPITRGRPVLRLAGTMEELLARREELGDCWLSVVLDCEQAEPGLGARLRQAFPEAVEVRLKARETTARARRATLQGLDDRERFVRYLADEKGVADPPERRLRLFEELLEQVEGRQEAELEEVA